MNRGRKFAYIYEINSLEIKAYLLPGTDSLIQAHCLGVTQIARIGTFVIINSGGNKIVGIIDSLHVTEPEKLYWLKTRQEFDDKQLIRTIVILLIGQLYIDEKNEPYFERGISTYPSLDEEVLVPTQDELNIILNEKIRNCQKLIEIGIASNSNDTRVNLDPVRLFSRHCAVVGSTGNGKSCTVTVLINEVTSKKIKIPIFIFDINGEYSAAFRKIDNITIFKFVNKMPDDYPRKGKIAYENVKINFTSFSRRTWRSILKPSEKTQIPALNFAIDVLKYLPLSINRIEIPDDLKNKVPQVLNNNQDKPFYQYLLGDPSENDYAKLENSFKVVNFLNILSLNHQRIKLSKIKKKNQIEMICIAKIIADRWSIQYGRDRKLQIDTFRYSNVSHLCDRINELYRDNFFRLFCDVCGKEGYTLEFLIGDNKKYCPITIYDLSAVPQEYLPLLVNSILEQNLIAALKGKYKRIPRLLVLDEAHHYLGKQKDVNEESIYLGNTPGDRIAKEGRKYGLHLLVSTQRPGELSDTIMAQTGTVIAHALTNETDRKIVSSFGNYNDRSILNELSIMPRREAIIIGEAISMPTRVKSTYLPEEIRPESKDPLENKI
ncbi:MAG: ATP-binding protein [Eubacteriales bacterium]